MPRLHRRLLLTTTALGGAVSLAGCARPTWLEEPGAVDVPVVNEAAGLCSVLAAAAASAPALAAMHRAHLEALQKISRKPIPTPTSAPAPGPLLPQEQAAVQHFATLADRAHDGRLARLLAEMAAGIQQRVALGGIA